MSSVNYRTSLCCRLPGLNLVTVLNPFFASALKQPVLPVRAREAASKLD